MKRKIIIGLIAVAVLVSGFLFFGIADKSETSEIVVPVKSGKFIVDITTTGELEAKNSVKIMGPSGLREFGIRSVSIQDIVDEGTMVRKGEWIATLDKSEFYSELQNEQLELEQKVSEYIQVQLDTTLQMRQSRDELINLAYAVEAFVENIEDEEVLARGNNNSDDVETLFASLHKNRDLLA